MENKHTEGPLNVISLGETESTNQGWLVRKQHVTLAVVRSCEFDAKLYASAPELLEAAIRGLSCAKSLDCKASRLDSEFIEKAIAKATGN